MDSIAQHGVDTVQHMVESAKNVESLVFLCDLVAAFKSVGGMVMVSAFDVWIILLQALIDMSPCL